MVKAKLQKNPNPNPEEIQAWAKEIKCSSALVYKWKARLPETLTRAVEAHEPVLKIEEEAEEVIEEPAEEGFEVPEEFREKAKPEVVTEEEEAEEEIVIEEDLEAQKQERLNKIATRAIIRFFDIGTEEGLGLGKDLGLTDQEADDTSFLGMCLIAKYLKVEIVENLLEITSGLHFGSIGLKLLVAWIKKRRKEAKEREAREKEEEERRRLEEVRKTEKKEEPKPEIAEEASTENVAKEPEKSQAEIEKDLKKKWVGG